MSEATLAVEQSLLKSETALGLISTDVDTDTIDANVSKNVESTAGAVFKLIPTNKRRRWTRANNLLGKLIPPLLVVLAWRGSHLVLVQVANYLRFIQYTSLFWVRAYQIQFIAWLTLLVTCFLIVYTTDHTRASPSSQYPFEPPLEVKQRKVIFECNPDGTPTTCTKCQGRWRPTRTRHCNDCDICVPGFDHHCPFMDACIGTKSIKPFFCFLVDSPIIPLIPLQSLALQQVLSTTWSSTEMDRIWWKRSYSWAAGPVSRYIGGLILSYRIHTSLPFEERIPLFTVPKESFSVDPIRDFPLLWTPHLTPLILCTAAVFVVCVAVAMILTIYLNARQGVSTIEVERRRRYNLMKLNDNRSRSKKNLSIGKSPEQGTGALVDPRIRLYIPPLRKEGEAEAEPEPDNDDAERGRIVLVEPNQSLFDLGPKNNLSLLLGRSDRGLLGFWEGFLPWKVPTPLQGDEMFNPVVIQQLRQTKARKDD